MYALLLTIHLLSATIWTGGHLILFTRVLIPALKSRSVDDIRKFEGQFEVIGIPALITLVITGLLLARQLLPDFSAWFTAESVVSRTVILKLSFLLTTALLAVHARLKIIPTLSEKTLNSLAVHVTLVTLLSVLFAITGVLNRFGGIW